MIRRWVLGLALAAAGVLLVALPAPHAAGTGGGQRVTLTGEVVDSWCQISGVMEAEGSAHHQCAVFCLAGGIPVGLLTEDGRVYIVLKSEGDTHSATSPRWIDLATRKVTVSADLIERDGTGYLIIDKIVTDHGLVNVNHVGKTLWPFGEEP